jgi:transcriptional antiterminator NusG
MSNPKQWFIVHTYSGFENRVRETLKNRISAYNLAERFGEILLPTEKFTEQKGDKTVTKERKFLPGYLLVEMEMTEEAWQLVRNTPKVTGFLGSATTPTPVPPEEVDRVRFTMQATGEAPRVDAHFERGDKVKINEGAFSGFNGAVEEVHDDRQLLKVMVTIFGRSTPVEVNYAQVEKI